ncbi:acyltransferase family protein [Chryseobacterium sp. MMS23-Vi53]|uniref:acyltransferase family protein n=1 Tax=Chryseobacterium sp. MMS23-Vi53 TaxID=3386644 RepID=UPI0039E7414F
MKLNNLQILRGISALLVCCYHFREYINFENLKLGNILFINGSIGVQIFFVISGFIMAFTTKNLDVSKNISTKASSFFKKRIIRIVPLYYLLTLAWMVIGGSFLFYFERENFSRLFYSVLFLPQKNTFPVLYLGWSLNYEMFFYFIFGLSLFFKEKRYIFIGSFFFVSYLFGLIFNLENAYLQMVTSNLNLFFVAGILLFFILNKYPITKKWGAIISSIGILFFCLMFFNIITVTNQLLLLIIITLFVLSFLMFDYTFQFKGNRALIFLGDISFSLYLSHPFVEIFFRHFKIEGYLNIPYLIFKIFVVIFVAGVLYYFVEKKLTDYLKLKLKA